MGRIMKRGPRRTDLSRPKIISRSLYKWAVDSDHSIWLQHDRTSEIIGMSNHFRDIMRPLFYRIYRDIFIRGRAHMSIGKCMEVSRRRNKVKRITGHSIKNPSAHDILMVLKGLREIVEFVVRVEKPSSQLSPLPKVVTKFFELSQYICGREPTSFREMRILTYFMTINPIVLNESENMKLLDKFWNMWNMNWEEFEDNVPMLELAQYTSRIRSDMKELWAVYNFQRDLYDDPSSAIRYALNLKRHVQNTTRKSSLHDIYRHTMLILSDLIPTCFFEVTLKFWEKPRFLYPEWTLVTFLQESPYIDVGARCRKFTCTSEGTSDTSTQFHGHLDEYFSPRISSLC